MNFLASLNDHVGRLVHPAVQSKPLEDARHRMFLATRLAVSFGGMALALVCLAAGHIPHWWETAALGWLVLPVAAAILASRTGNLEGAGALSFAAWIGLSASLAGGSGAEIGLGLLLLVPLEAVAGRLFRYAGPAIAAAAGVAGLFALHAEFFKLAFVSAPLGVFGAAILAAGLLYAGFIVSIAGRLEALRSAQEAAGQDRYQALSDAIDEVVLRFDRSGLVLDASPASDRVLGVKPRDLIGRGLFERIHVADRPVFLKAIIDAACTAGDRIACLRVRTGTRIPSQAGPFQEPVFAWAEIRVRGLSGEDAPRASAVTAVLRDVTEHKLREQREEEARKAAERDTAGRDLFLANVSHELRTPLNAIIGFAEMLASEQLRPRDAAKQREYAGIIHHSGQHLLSVVNTILDASKIEAGSFEIFPEAFDLEALIHTCCDMVGLKAQQGEIDLVRDIAPRLDEIVGDSRACKQVLLNLLSNALKFTPARGRVTIGARPDGHWMTIFVADSGIGISPRDLPKIGDPFFQAHSTYDRSYDGTGLGLSVVRGLVGLHGGSIVIESAPGQGTRVTIRLPSDCRRLGISRNSVTKIETIPRYYPPVTSGDVSDLAKVHKIA